MPEKSREDYAWAAGLFDAEGYAKIEFRPSLLGSTVPVMKLGMVHVEAVERFADIVGVGTLHVAQPRPQHQPLRVWSAASRQACIAAQALVEFAVVKAPRLQEILDHYDNFHVRAALLRAKMCKLTEEQVREIRRSTESLSVLAKRYAVATTTVSSARNGKTWAHLKD